MNPFFIAGTQRSGTTMLSVMLGNHPDVLMENNVKAFRVIGAFYNMYDLLGHNLDLPKAAFVSWTLENDKNDRVHELIDQSFINEETDIRSIIRDSIDLKLKENNRRIWGDKAPNLQHYIADLLLLIPDAKIIHIVRDGRATASSMSKRTYRNIKVSAQMWVDGNIFGLVNQYILGTKNYKIIKYEDLIHEPEETMKQVCVFLGLKYHNEVITLSDQEEGKESYVKSFFDVKKIDAWKNQLTPKQIRKIAEIQGPLLEKLGYQVEYDKHKPIGNFKMIRLKQWDNFKMLFRSKKKGMKDRKMVEYNDSFKKRLGSYLILLGNDIFSRPINKKLFSKFNYKKRKKNLN